MRINFSKLSSQTPEEKKLMNYRINVRLAEASLEYAKTNPSKANESLYVALEHLATIEECNININNYNEFDYLSNSELDTDLYVLVKEKLKLAKSVIVQENI